MNISEIQQRMTRKDWNAIVIPLTVMLAKKQPISWIRDRVQRKTGLEIEKIDSIITYIIGINNICCAPNLEIEAKP